MKPCLFAGLAGAVCVVNAARAEATRGAVPEKEALGWIRHLVPLPRHVELKETVVVPANRVRIEAPEDAPPLVRQAMKELQECLGGPASEQPVFTLVLRSGDPRGPEFAKAKHKDQAYTIRHAEKGDRLVLMGGGVRGTYYAGKTMQQLLQAGRRGETVEIPLVRVTDWPDMEDRGFWGGDSYERLRWMSDRKLNYDEQISTTGVDEQKQRYVRLHGSKQKLLDEGPTYGINPVPVVLHLEQLTSHGIFKAHPELAGKNGRPGSICYSNPLFVEILTDWLAMWGEKPGVKEVDVWMAENLQGEKGCQCEGCVKEDRSVLEARAILAAWNKAKERNPSLGLRVLSSEETEAVNPRILAELPKDVKFWYYHSLWTYNTGRLPMIHGYLVEAIKGGRWVGVCPNLCAAVGTWQPFTCAPFIHYRMNEYVDKGVEGLLGYAVPVIRHVRLNAEAAAEWSWNAKGRSPHEFALSWAVRQGIQKPETFAEWSDTYGPIAWNVHGSDWVSASRRTIPAVPAELLKQGKLPELGFLLWGVYGSPWSEVKSVDHLERNVVGAGKAVRLAKEIGIDEFIYESVILQGHVRAMKALWELKQIVKATGVAEPDKAAARRWFAEYAAGIEQARTALPAWEDSLGEPRRGERWVADTVKLLGEMMAEMQETQKSLGCE